VSAATDVVIAGGGPAGSAAAITLLRAGATVTIVDKHRFPRDKPCGDGVTPRGVAMLDLLGVGDQARAAFNRVERVRIHVGGRAVRRPLPHKRAGLPTYGLVARRTVLDAMLLAEAERLGAVVLPGTKVEGLVWSGPRVTGVRVAGGAHLPSRLVVGADGATSRVARSLGVRDDRTVFGYAIRAEIAAEVDDVGCYEIFPRLIGQGDALVPGYGWAFPLDAHTFNIGVGFVTGEHASKITIPGLRTSLAGQLPERWGVDLATAEASWSGWKLLMGLGRSPLWRPGVLLAGDAAGVVRPTSGAGISKALRSGYHAGVVAARALERNTTDDLSPYADALRAELGRSYGFGRAVARAINRPVVMAAFTAALSRPSTARIVEDLISDLRSPDAITTTGAKAS
jgi:geranylgeranyl reductase family protein